MAMAKGNSKKVQKDIKISKKVQNKTNNTKSKKECKNLVSCLMLTYDRLQQKPISSIAMFESSVRQFAEQSYLNRELIVVCSGSKSYYDDCVAKVEEIKNDTENFECSLFYVTREEYPTIADLRNKAVSEANGDYIMTWDDDDSRSLTIIEKQMKAMKENDADIVMSQRLKVCLQFGKNAFDCNYYGGFEPTMLAKKSNKIIYDAKDKEDAEKLYIERLKESGYKEFVISDNECSDYLLCYWNNNVKSYDYFASIVTISQKRGI